MPSAPKPPPPIDVKSVTSDAQKANLTAGQESQALSTMDQNNAYGNLKYTTSIDPITGLPKYVANTTYSADQQAILDQLEKNQQGIGGTAGSAIASTFGQYEGDPDLVGGANSLTQQALDSQDPAWERFMAPERAQLDTSLRNQGILPGTPAYQQQVDALTNQQNLTKGQWLANFQPQAFQEAQTQYETPLQNVLAMLGVSQPANLNNSFINTPGANIGAVDVAGLSTTAQNEAFKNYQMKVADQNAKMGMVTGGLGSMAKLPTGQGSSVGGDFMSMLML